jgi:hypothetical protein
MQLGPLFHFTSLTSSHSPSGSYIWQVKEVEVESRGVDGVNQCSNMWFFSWNIASYSKMVSCRWVVPNTLRFGAMDAVVESNPLCSFPISPSFFFLFFSKLSSSFIYHVNALSLVFLNNCKFL